MHHFSLFKFYGVDWVAMVFQFSSIYALGGKHRYGFVLGMCGTAAWLVFGFITGSVADIAANMICLGMNVHAYMRWSAKES
jgi:hypothetical protein